LTFRRAASTEIRIGIGAERERIPPVELPTDLGPVDLDLLGLPSWIKKLIRDGNEWDEAKDAW
jgi:hypothetical protein